jgi:acetyl/propionyl-CoA carboxylase alpha subunit
MPSGPGVRVDTALEPGDRVPPEYDNLIAKVMVHASDRGAAIDRLRRALDEAEVTGIQTTLPFHRYVVDTPSFQSAQLSTDWVGDHWDGPAQFARAASVAMLAAGLVAIHDADSTPRGSGDGGSRQGGGWRLGGWRATGLQDATDRWPR